MCSICRTIFLYYAAIRSLYLQHGERILQAEKCEMDSELNRIIPTPFSKVIPISSNFSLINNAI